MKLAELAAAVPRATLMAGGDFEVREVVYDSRRAGPGDLFVAVAGLTVDGHQFAADAAARGAAVALARPVPLPDRAAWILLADTRTGLGELAAAFFGFPSRKLQVAGVTGTDGKTTVTHMAAHALEVAGRRSGLMSTVAFSAGAASTDNTTGQTSPEAPEVQAWLARMAGAGIESAVIEVTSHALVQGRVAACDFDVAAITYIGRDHLDYHASWDDYVEAKARLLQLCADGAQKGIEKTAILNRDDASYEHLARHWVPRRWSYGISNDADIMARDLVTGEDGSWFNLVTPFGAAPVRLRMPARFNVSNALCAAGILLAFGIGVGDIARGIGGFHGVRGRLERVAAGQPFGVFIDFAHSAGSLASVLAELRPLTRGRLIAVFGSTGRSDHDRPGMGRSAAAGADFFVITSDDPVNEDPAEIARQVASGAEAREPGRDFEIILDRSAAIERAISMASPGDTVLLAGKGHERSMITARGREPWDERAAAEAAIRGRADAAAFLPADQSSEGEAP